MQLLPDRPGPPLQWASFGEPRFRIGGQQVFALAGIGSFSEEVLLSREAAIRIPRNVPWDVAAIVGCGVPSGVGAAINAAKVVPGSSVIVFGCGGGGHFVSSCVPCVGGARNLRLRY